MYGPLSVSRSWHLTLPYSVLMAVLGFSGGTPASAAQPEYRIAPPEAWVQQITPEDAPPVPAGQISDGVHYLLTDVQTRVESTDRAQYRHFAMKALNESGLGEVANIEIGFDPSYHTLTLHNVQIRRGTRVISKLETAPIRVLQREKELEYRIYNGGRTANIFLDDVRAGDVVEYAYTVRGTNPVFANRLFGRLDFQWAVPVRRVYTRLLWPAEREVYFKSHRTNLEPVVHERNGYREYVWETRRVPALVVESNTPGWYDPYPWVQWSEYKDWESVARWAQPLYRVPPRLSAGLQAEVERIATTANSPRERLLAALRFVQREIRYLGVEIGAGSHAPSAPQLVLERRFGDCKDKTLLTVTLLRALGIEARPALVHTATQRGIYELHPTPNAFNHVLVVARLDGREYWIDPTRSSQKGDLASLYQPNYGYALIVDTATRALTPMPASVVAKRAVYVVFDARTGFDEPVRYTVTGKFEGASAEAQRATLAAENREELQKKYLNFYARYYPSATTAKPFTVREEEPANRVTVTEHYLIPGFWKHIEAQKRRETEIHTPDVAEFLRRPREPVRRAPLYLAHPVDVTQTTEVLLPDKWNIKPERITVEDPAFEFERNIAYDANDRRLVISDRYRSRVDHVEPADVPRYVANLDRAEGSIGYSLIKHDRVVPAPTSWIERFNWSVAVLGFVILSVAGWLAIKRYRYDPPAIDAPADPTLHGLGGWLILPAIGVIVMPIRILVDFLSTLPSYAAETWANLTTVGSAGYHPLWAPLLLYELSANLTLIVCSILLAIMFFQKRRGVPLLFIGVVGGSVVVQAIDLMLGSFVPAVASEMGVKAWGELARGVIGALLWGSYFLVSRRVKSTFVNSRRRANPSIVAAPAG